jgi:hypothetical protein
MLFIIQSAIEHQIRIAEIDKFVISEVENDQLVKTMLVDNVDNSLRLSSKGITRIATFETLLCLRQCIWNPGYLCRCLKSPESRETGSSRA